MAQAAEAKKRVKGKEREMTARHGVRAARVRFSKARADSRSCYFIFSKVFCKICQSFKPFTFSINEAFKLISFVFFVGRLAL